MIAFAIPFSFKNRFAMFLFVVLEDSRNFAIRISVVKLLREE
jgi:hypothetical protein